MILTFNNMNNVIKWKPLLVMTNIDNIYWEDVSKHMEFLFKKGVKPERLAMELRIISSLDLSKVWFTTDLKLCKEYQWNLRIQDDDLFNMSIPKIDIESRVESSLRDELIFTLGRHIEKEGGLIIYDLYNITNIETTLVTVKSHYSPYNVTRFNKLKKVRTLINDRYS
jgi:hypothetical protein